MAPALPLLVTSLGGDQILVGLLFGAFSIASFVFRPFIGVAVDIWGAQPVLRFGTLGMAFAGLAHLAYTPLLLLGARVFHGVAWACLNTATSVAVARIAPSSRRAEALGYFTMSQALGSTVGPVVALWLIGVSGFPSVFIFSAVCGLIALAATQFTPAPSPPAAQPRMNVWHGIFDQGALVPATMLGLSLTVTPAVQVFIVLYALELGIEHLSLYFVAYGVTNIVARGGLGRLSDRLPRSAAILLGLLINAAGLVLLFGASGLQMLILGGVVQALGQALSLPSIFALAVDSTSPERRGAAMANFTAAYQVGLAAGSVVWGYVSTIAGFRAMYLVALVPLALAAAVAIQAQRVAGRQPATADRA